MNLSQKEAAGNCKKKKWARSSQPRLSPTDYEYYRIQIPPPSGHSPEVRYRKHLIALDHSSQLGTNSITMETLDEHQV
ncbi:hypothetical protein RUND412_004057, partial [Rhizina undulata]